MENKIHRGDIYYATLEENAIGSEQIGTRPVVIIQNDIGNEFSTTVIIVPITSKTTKAKIPTHVPLKNLKYRRIKDSMILAEQIRIISKDRLGTCIGRLDEEETKLMDNALFVAIGINIEELKAKKDKKELLTRNQIASYGIVAKEYLNRSGNIEISNKLFGDYIITLMDLYTPKEVEKVANKYR